MPHLRHSVAKKRKLKLKKKKKSQEAEAFQVQGRACAKAWYLGQLGKNEHYHPLRDSHVLPWELVQ